MALPIGPTPTLYGKEAEEFTKKIEEDLKKPVGLTPTPKLAEARRRMAAKAKRYCDTCQSIIRRNIGGRYISFICGEDDREIGRAVGGLTVCPRPEWCGKVVER